MKNTPKTALDICNAALKKLGEPDAFLISSLNPNGVLASRLCYMHYHPARREVLCHGNWRFARTAVWLSPTTLQPGVVPFQLPMDCLRVHDVSCCDWVLKGRYVHCDAKNIHVKYTADIEDVEQFSKQFIKAFVLKLACKLCIPLTMSTPMLTALREEYNNLIESCR